MTFVRVALALVVLSATASAQVPSRNQTNAAGSAGVAGRMQSLGYKDTHDLRRDANGEWTGKATRNGVPSTVTVKPEGSVIRR